MPWLAVHDNYKTLNLKKQKADEISHYKLYTALTEMRKTDLLRTGNMSVSTIGNHVVSVIRENSQESAALLINLSNSSVTVDVPGNLKRSLNRVVLGSVNSGLKAR